MARLRPLCILLLLMAAVPATAAAPNLTADITATSLRLGNSYHADGMLLALLQEQTGGCTAPADFRVEAASIRVENDTAAVALHAGSSYPTYLVNPSTSPESHGASIVQGTANRDGCRWDLTPLDGGSAPRVEIAGSCANANPADAATVQRTPIVNPARGGVEVDTSKAIKWDTCSDGTTVRITGSFQLSLWEWDCTLTANGQTESITTGHRPVQGTPTGTPDASNFIAEDQETYLFVTDGVLTTSLARANHLLYAAAADLDATTLELAGASGRLMAGSNHLDLAGSAIAVHGQAHASIHGTAPGKPFVASLNGDPQQVVVNGADLALVVPAPPSWTERALPLAVLVLGAVLIAIHIWRRPLVLYAAQEGTPGVEKPTTLRERRGQGYWLMSVRALKRDRLRLGLHYARRARKLFPTSADAQLMEVVALHKSGHHVALLALIGNALRRAEHPEQRALCAGLAAKSAVCLGRLEEAIPLLKRAAADDLPMFETMIQDDLLNPLLADPWFKAIREGAPSKSGPSTDAAFA